MENYEVIQVIGSGSSGNVEKIVRKSDKKALVWKKLDYGKMHDKEKSQLVQEVNILRDLRHPNIVRYYDRIIDKENQHIYIIQEYCSGGDLQKFLQNSKINNQLLSENHIWRIFTHIVLAVHEIHKRKEGKILHRDIKPANIFLDQYNNVKLGDFGFSKRLTDEAAYAYTNIGTPYYMSPEQINENKYNEKSDIWSLGCLLYEMACLSPPFTATNSLSLAMKIKNGKFERIPNQYSDELMRVIIWCLHKNMESRPQTEDLLNIPQISNRLREKRLKDNIVILNQRDEELEVKMLGFQQEELKLGEKIKKIEAIINQKLIKITKIEQTRKKNSERKKIQLDEEKKSQFDVQRSGQKTATSGSSTLQTSDFKYMCSPSQKQFRPTSAYEEERSNHKIKK